MNQEIISREQALKNNFTVNIAITAALFSIHSLAPGMCSKYFKSVMSEHMFSVMLMSTCKIALI